MLKDLASSDSNAFQVSDMNEVKEHFADIADSLIKVSTSINYGVYMPGGYPTGQIRYTFDNANSAESSKLYIEGTYNKKTATLENIVYQGFAKGATSIKAENGPKGTLYFQFDNLRYTDGSTVSEGLSFTLWQQIDGDAWKSETEITSADYPPTVDVDLSSALIMLVLDCTTSLTPDNFRMMQEAAKEFVRILGNGGSGNGGNGGDTTPGGDTGDTTPGGDTGDTAWANADPVFSMGPYTVKTTDIASDTDGAPREFRIYEPTGATGNIPVIHFLHGFMYKIGYYDNILTHLASHGFIVVSSQSEHTMMGGDTTIAEAEKVVTFINWLKQNIQSKVSVTADVKHFGVSGHSRGGKVTNRVLNTDPAMATSFFAVDPVDTASSLGEDSTSLSDPVQFKGESFFLGTELGPNGMAACAPAGENSANFYAKYPSVSHHIIAAGVGHTDMVDDQSECGMYCSTCVNSGNNALNQQFMSYTGGLMAAFFNSTLKGMTAYETLLNDSSKHPFQTKVVEHK